MVVTPFFALITGISCFLKPQSACFLVIGHHIKGIVAFIQQADYVLLVVSHLMNTPSLTKNCFLVPLHLILPLLRVYILSLLHSLPFHCLLISLSLLLILIAAQRILLLLPIVLLLPLILLVVTYTCQMN